jgi:SAM-dependent methyltransferase/uncharacterized protein YbaR (Trm112 family)
MECGQERRDWLRVGVVFSGGDGCDETRRDGLGRGGRRVTPRLLEYLCCLRCGNAKLALGAAVSEGDEVVEGAVTCADCGAAYPVRDGIADFLIDAREPVLQEIEGHRQLGERWLTETVPPELHPLVTGPGAADVQFDLPRCAHPELVAKVPIYGRLAALADDFFELLERLALRGDEVAVDVGACTCWSTRYLAERCRLAIATDVSPFLEAAQVYRDRGVHFERVRCDMDDLPLRPECADLVFGAAVLHHSGNLERTLRGIGRILRPGGRAVFFDEPVCGRWDAAGRAAFGAEEKALGIQEHVYTAGEHFRAARRAGLRLEVLPLRGLLADPRRRWRFARRMGLAAQDSGVGYTAPFTRGVYRGLLVFYPRIPFPRFAYVFGKK